MSDKTYHLRDIPKKQRLQHLWYYYKLHMLLGAALAIMIGYGICGFFRPEPDLQVMWLSDEYSLDCEFALRETLEELDWDTNQDGSVRVLLTYIDFDRPYQELSYDSKAEITVLAAGEDYSFFLAGQDAVNWMRENDLLGTWNELGVTDAGGKTEVLIPASEIPAFSEMQELEETFLCMTTRPGEKQRWEEYDRQTQALREFLEDEGVL